MTDLASIQRFLTVTRRSILVLLCLFWALTPSAVAAAVRDAPRAGAYRGDGLPLDYADAYARYDEATREAVQRFREAHDLDFIGNPRGLVDERLVEALNRLAARAAEPGNEADAAAGDEHVQ